VLALELVDANAAGTSELDIESVYVICIGVTLVDGLPSIELPNLVILRCSWEWRLLRCLLLWSSCSWGHLRRSHRRLRIRRRRGVCV
jgi:hypothetical protein